MHKMQALKDIIKESIKSVKECQDNINEFKSFQKKTRDESEKLDKVNSDVANLEMENGVIHNIYCIYINFKFLIFFLKKKKKRK